MFFRSFCCAQCRVLCWKSPSIIRTRYIQMCQTNATSSSPPVPKVSESAPQVQASGNPLLKPNMKQYSGSVFLYTNPSVLENVGTSRPLLLFLPWLGSKPHSYKKYIQLYFNHGFDVLVAESSLHHFLWPRTGLDYAGQLLDLLIKEKELSSRPLCVHAISIGAYIFAQMLVKSASGQQEQRDTLKRIHGQVFDSLVIGSMEKMAVGVATMISYPIFKPLVVRGSLLYFSLLKAQTSDYYEQGIQTFSESPIPCPTLFFYCMNDPMSDHVAVEHLLLDWKSRGIKAQGKKWKSSIHAGHLRKHTKEYTETLDSFLQELQVSSPKSKL